MNWQPLIQPIRRHIPNLLAIYGFGSRLHPWVRADSDWDMALLVPGKLEPLFLWELANQLAEAVQNPVDLLDLRAVTTVMQYQIITTGQRLWQKDVQAALYESWILSEKTALDEARAPLVAMIGKEGSIYGR